MLTPDKRDQLYHPWKVAAQRSEKGVPRIYLFTGNITQGTPTNYGFKAADVWEPSFGGLDQSQKTSYHR